MLSNLKHSLYKLNKYTLTYKNWLRLQSLNKNESQLFVHKKECQCLIKYEKQTMSKSKDGSLNIQNPSLSLFFLFILIVFAYFGEGIAHRRGPIESRGAFPFHRLRLCENIVLFITTVTPAVPFSATMGCAHHCKPTLKKITLSLFRRQIGRTFPSISMSLTESKMNKIPPIL